MALVAKMGETGCWITVVFLALVLRDVLCPSSCLPALVCLSVCPSTCLSCQGVPSAQFNKLSSCPSSQGQAKRLQRTQQSNSRHMKSNDNVKINKDYCKLQSVEANV